MQILHFSLPSFLHTQKPLFSSFSLKCFVTANFWSPNSLAFSSYLFTVSVSYNLNNFLKLHCMPWNNYVPFTCGSRVINAFEFNQIREPMPSGLAIQKTH